MGCMKDNGSNTQNISKSKHRRTFCLANIIRWKNHEFIFSQKWLFYYKSLCIIKFIWYMWWKDNRKENVP